MHAALHVERQRVGHSHVEEDGRMPWESAMEPHPRR
jgi:hypothetical protein